MNAALISYVYGDLVGWTTPSSIILYKILSLIHWLLNTYIYIKENSYYSILKIFEMVMARKPIKKPGFPDNIIGYTLWIKGTEWKKWIIMKIKEKKKTKYVAQKEYNLATIEERRNFLSLLSHKLILPLFWISWLKDLKIIIIIICRGQLSNFGEFHTLYKQWFVSKNIYDMRTGSYYAYSEQDIVGESIWASMY